MFMLTAVIYLVICFLAITSLQGFVHSTTAQLSCHLQKVVAITGDHLGESKIKFPSNLSAVGNIFSETGHMFVSRTVSDKT